jgi:hypothetical protein
MQQEAVSYPPPLVIDDALLCDEEKEEDEFSNFQTLHVMTQTVTLLITLMSSYMLEDVGGI